MTINEKYTWWSNSTGFFFPNPHDIPKIYKKLAQGSAHRWVPRLSVHHCGRCRCCHPPISKWRLILAMESSWKLNMLKCHPMTLYIYIYLFIYLRYDMVIYLYMVIYRPMVQSSPPSVSVSVIAASRVGYHHSSWQHVDLCTQQLCSTQVRRASTVEEHLHSLPLRRCVAWRKYGEVMVKLGDQHVSTRLKTMKIWVSSRWK